MKLFWFSIKNYFRSYKYIFTPLGIISLFLIISLSIAIPGIINAVMKMVNTIAQTFEGYTIDWDKTGGYFTNFLMQQNWGDLNGTVAKFTDPAFLSESFTSIVLQIFPDLPVDMALVQATVSECVSQIFTYVLLVLVFVILGFIISFFLTRMFVKQEIVKRRIWQRIVFSLLDAAISLLVIWGVLSVLKLGPAGIPLVILILLAQAILSIVEGWLIHGFKTIKLKHVLNFKNVLALILSSLLIIVLGVGTVLLVNLLGMTVVTVVIALSMFIITNAVVTANSEGYVGYMAHEGLYKKEIKKLENSKKDKKSDEKKEKLE